MTASIWRPRPRYSKGATVPPRDVFQFRRKDGEWRWADAQLNRIEFHGQAALLLAVVDITERKLAQDKMQENVQRRSCVRSWAHRWRVAIVRAVLDNLTHVVVGALGDICVVRLVVRRPRLAGTRRDCACQP